MKILVAIDDSQYSYAAVEDLGARPWWGDTQFRIVNVCAVPTVKQWEVWGMDVDWKLRDKIMDEAKKLVEDQVALLKKLVARGIEIEGKVLEGHGHVSDDIVQEASEWEADLIVVGSHGRTGFQKLMVGSVAQGVLLHAPCSVEVIKCQNALDKMKISAAARVAATDDSAQVVF